MKFLFTFFLSCVCLASFAKKPERLKISTGKNAKVEIRYVSKYKKSTPAIFTVTDAAGKTVSTQSAGLSCGNNSVCLCEALDLPEGTYTVSMTAKNKTYTSQFIIWK